jgi:alkylation response protein AidB-like acyl-CoA dehydrogenase
MLNGTWLVYVLHCVLAQAKKFIALCVSEPYAGSDVANLRTTAKREGDHYILNGEKKWITWAIHADFFTVACRTGGPGMGGISVILVERNSPGVSVKRMKLQGNWLAGTCYVNFDDVKVPVNNLIGQENQGFKVIMQNFNHERFVIAVQTCRFARICLREAIEYAQARKTFGKRLVDHQAPLRPHRTRARACVARARACWFVWERAFVCARACTCSCVRVRLCSRTAQLSLITKQNTADWQLCFWPVHERAASNWCVRWVLVRQKADRR